MTRHRAVTQVLAESSRYMRCAILWYWRMTHSLAMDESPDLCELLFPHLQIRAHGKSEAFLELTIKLLLVASLLPSNTICVTPAPSQTAPPGHSMLDKAGCVQNFENHLIDSTRSLPSECIQVEGDIQQNVRGQWKT